MPIKKPAGRVVVAPANNFLNFGDLATYVAGGGIPEGNYALEFMVQEYQATKQDGSVSGPLRLGIMLTAHSLDGAEGEPKTKFLGLGSKALDAFAPDPETGKKIVIRPDGSGAQTLPESTNWGLFLQSLYQSGLPQGVFTNDVSVLDGVHVHMVNVPEPEGRKSFQSATSEVQGEKRQNSTVPNVTEILEGGAPWEGGGGVPDGKPAPKAAKPAAGKPVAKPVAAAAKKPVVVQEAEPAGDEELMQAAVSGVTAVLEKNPDGCGKLVLRTGTFKAVNGTEGEDVANAVINGFFGSDEALDSVLEQLGYMVSGQKIVPQAQI